MGVRDLLAGIIRAGGTLTTEAEYRRRMAICERCPRAGVVSVLGIDYSGCTQCGCPFVTKCRSKWHPLDGGTVKCPEKKW